jgi:hypothetical protein
LAADGRRIAAGLALPILVAGCLTAPSPTASPEPSPAPTFDVGEPGRPFDAADLLEAMRSSPRPGGVPDQLETEAIAAAIAERIWTLSGAPWPAIVAGGSCGPDACTLEVAGTPTGAPGEDLYVFSVMPDTETVELESAELRGLPASLLPELEALAMGAMPQDALAGLRLASARWLPPPDEGQFVLSFRSGGEEFSCGIDLVLDARRAVVADQRTVNC